MESNPNHNLRIQFIKNRTFKKFVDRLKADPTMFQYVNEIDSSSVLFKFDSEEMKDYCLDLFSKQLNCKVKKTKYGHKYLKVR